MISFSHWLVLFHHCHGTDASVMATEDARGPLAHVPAGEDPTTWLVDVLFGEVKEPDMSIEVRALGVGWKPEVWPLSSPPVFIQAGTSLRMR